MTTTGATDTQRTPSRQSPSRPEPIPVSPVPGGTCGHERAVWRIAHRALSWQHRASLACTLASKMYCDEIIARCQTRCGTQSPFRDVTLRPFTRRSAVECLRRHGSNVTGDDAAAAMVRFALHNLRALLGR